MDFFGFLKNRNTVTAMLEPAAAPEAVVSIAPMSAPPRAAHPRSIDFLLGLSPAEQVAKLQDGDFLCDANFYGAVGEILLLDSKAGVEDKICSIVAALDPALKTQLLSSEGFAGTWLSLYWLGEKATIAQRGEAFLGFVRELTSEQQVQVLVTPLLAARLQDAGKIDALLDVVRNLPPAMQTKLLLDNMDPATADPMDIGSVLTSFKVWDKGNEIIEIIAALPNEEKMAFMPSLVFNLYSMCGEEQRKSVFGTLSLAQTEQIAAAVKSTSLTPNPRELVSGLLQNYAGTAPVAPKNRAAIDQVTGVDGTVIKVDFKPK